MSADGSCPWPGAALFPSYAYVKTGRQANKMINVYCTEFGVIDWWSTDKKSLLCHIGKHVVKQWRHADQRHFLTTRCTECSVSLLYPRTPPTRSGCLLNGPENNNPSFLQYFYDDSFFFFFIANRMKLCACGCIIALHLASTWFTNRFWSDFCLPKGTEFRYSDIRKLIFWLFSVVTMSITLLM